MRLLGAVVSLLSLHAVHPKSEKVNEIKYVEKECGKWEIMGEAAKLEDGRMFKACYPVNGAGDLPIIECKEDDNCKQAIEEFKSVDGVAGKLLCNKAKESNFEGLKELALSVMEKRDEQLAARAMEKQVDEIGSKMEKLMKGSKNICGGIKKCQKFKSLGGDTGICNFEKECKKDEDCKELNVEGIRMERKCESGKCKIKEERVVFGKFVDDKESDKEESDKDEEESDKDEEESDKDEEESDKDEEKSD